MHISRSLLLTSLLTVRCLALPLSFEQRDSRHFIARFGDSAIKLSPGRIVFRDVTLRFVNAAAGARMEGLGASSPSTYLRAGFARTFRQFPKLAIRNLYPGVDAIFYGSGPNLEYDLQVAPGATLDRVRISLGGASGLRIDESGNLVIQTATGTLQQLRPRVIQGKREIPARYVLLSANEVGIRLGKHDRRLPLTVDPVLAYVKNFAGSGSFNVATQIATDAQGNIYVTGQTNSVDFPTTSGSFEPAFAPGLRVLSNGGASNVALQLPSSAGATVVAGTADGSILYTATPGGILLSGDGGATWRKTAPLPVPQSPNGTFTPTVNAISIDPFDPATILVATNAGMFGTDTGGQIWGARDTGVPTSANGYVWATSVFYYPGNPLIAYATTRSPAFLMASADAGNSWRILNPTYPGEPPAPTDPYPPIALTLSADGNTLYVVNANGTLLTSTDGGQSWTKMAQGLSVATSIQLDPSNSSTIYVLDQDGLQKSTDGGMTFSAIKMSTRIQQFAVDSTGALYVSINGTVSVSTDGGATLMPVPHLSSVEVSSVSAVAGKVYVGAATPPIPFVIKLDPTGQNILYSTFLGGSYGDGISGLAVDSQGNAVIVGATLSPDFPLTIPAANPPNPAKADGYVARLSADGTYLLFSTALGGSKFASVQAVAIDSTGSIFITGQSGSTDFPITANAFQPAFPATPCTRKPFNPLSPLDMANHAFVSKLSPDSGSLVYSTFLTGSCGSYGQSITVDPAGNAIVTGYTTSSDFPATPNTYQPSFPGPVNQATVTDIFQAGFVSKLSPAGDKLLASTYLGGSFETEARAAALDGAGNIYVTGDTHGFATGATPGVYQSAVVDRCTPFFYIGPSLPYAGTGDAFVLKLDSALATARLLTYLGGSCEDSGGSIALDSAGNIWIGGSTSSPDFPLREPFQGSGVLGSPYQGFVTELSADASQLLFSTRSDGTALTLNSTGVYLAGGGANGAFVAKIDPGTTPSVAIDNVAPVAGAAVSTPTLSGLTTIAPGQLVQIAGRNLGPSAKVTAQLDPTNHLPFSLGNVVVFFDNIPAPLMSVQSNAIVCFVPFEVTSATVVTVLSNGQRSNPVRMGVSATAPKILNVVNADGTVNSADHPAKLGSVVAIYLSGLGVTNPPSADGLVTAAPFPVPVATIMLYMPGSSVQITPQSVTAAPGMIAGISQVNVQLPKTLTAANGVVQIEISGDTSQFPIYVSQ